MLEIKDAEFRTLTRYIQQNYGINLTRKRTLIEGRLSNIILEKGYHSFGEYIDYALNDPTGQEIVVLINRLTTNHTYFMREASHFDYFRDQVVPFVAADSADRDFRIWSAGCSTGEEPYTLEMILHESFSGGGPAWDTQILATDISERALAIARKGEYAANAVSGIPPMWKMNYFEKTDADTVRVRDTIRRDVVFRRFNLMEEQFPFRRKFHVIFCRNVMIYFDLPTKEALVRKFYQSLVDGGYLFIGHSESIDREASGFRYIMPAVYRKGRTS